MQCPECGDNDNMPVDENEDEYPVMECQTCGHTFMGNLTLEEYRAYLTSNALSLPQNENAGDKGVSD